MGSLALRLGAVIVAVFVPLQVIVGLAAYVHAERRSSVLVDRLLAQQADAMADAAALRDAQSPVARPAVHAARASPASGFQLWSGDNQLVAAAPVFAGLDLDATPAGFSDLMLEGHRWRVLTSLVRNRWIRVGQRHDVEDATLRALALQLAAFVLLGVPLMLVTLRIVLGRCLEPVDHLAEEIARSTLGRRVPIGPGELPRELEPIVASVNHLLTKCGRGERSTPRAFEAGRCESDQT
jgi:hypothetical protein